MAKLADKYAIGTEHVIDGKRVIVEASNRKAPCEGCAFYFEIGNMPCCSLPENLKGERLGWPVCYDVERTDHVMIIFKAKGGQQ